MRVSRIIRWLLLFGYTARLLEFLMGRDTVMPLQIRSTVKEEGALELTLVDIETPEPGPDEVVVRVEATPINPSDLGLLFGMADMASAEYGGTAESPVVAAPIPDKFMKAMGARVGQSLPVGNEGGGVVVAAGTSDEAQALIGKTVGVLGGAMYSQFRVLKVGLG